MQNEIVKIIDQLDHFVTDTDTPYLNQSLQDYLKVLELEYGRDLVMLALCEGYIIAARMSRTLG